MDRRPTPPRLRSSRREREPAGATILPLRKPARPSPDSENDPWLPTLELAEALVEHQPWQASLHARRVLAYATHDRAARAWAVLGLGQTYLGNYRYAITAYTHAVALCPDNIAYNHNLGHLLDLAENRPDLALPHLELAYTGSGDCIDVLASLLHALAGTGQIERALGLLATSTATGLRPRELRQLVFAVAAEHNDTEAQAKRRRELRRQPRLLSVLQDGLRHLPFGDFEAEAALTLAAEVLMHKGELTQNLRLTAAAIAWRVASSLYLPLSAAEVAAPFRVGLAAMRRRHALLVKLTEV